MDKMEAYKIWAPSESPWSEWAKPVLFAMSHQPQHIDLSDREIPWADSADAGTAIIVDQPGESGVAVALELAKLGYRPVPLYNGVCNTDRASMLVDSYVISVALIAAAQQLSAIRLPDDAPPAFLLDANRMSAPRKTPGKYDNRWCVFPQDMPSSQFLAANGIARVLVNTDVIRDDLAHILCRYQDDGLEILQTMGSSAAHVRVQTPPKYKSWFYRFTVVAGLTRNPTGGFGGMVPVPSDNRYHGYG